MAGRETLGVMAVPGLKTAIFRSTTLQVMLSSFHFADMFWVDINEMLAVVFRAPAQQDHMTNAVVLAKHQAPTTQHLVLWPRDEPAASFRSPVGANELGIITMPPTWVGREIGVIGDCPFLVAAVFYDTRYPPGESMMPFRTTPTTCPACGAEVVKGTDESDMEVLLDPHTKRERNHSLYALPHALTCPDQPRQQWTATA